MCKKYYKGPLLMFQLCPKKTSKACFQRFFESLLCYKNKVFISKGKYKQSNGTFSEFLSVNKALLYLQAYKNEVFLSKGKLALLDFSHICVKNITKAN